MKLESSVTLFDDNKVEDRFAELQVTADGITAEVGTKVGNDEVISRINQSAESIQIQANKVNIEGAAIFTSGRLSQSSLDGAYDASGSATSAVNGLKTDLSSASGTTVINGGHITTGTIDASKANITNINASNISTGTLSADRIGATSIGADKIKVSEINIGAAQITSGTINSARIPNLDASKITAGTISDSSGKNYWNLGTGQFVTKQGTIADFEISENSLTAEASTSTVTTKIAMNGTNLSAERIGKATSLYNGFKISGVSINSRFLSTDGKLLTGISIGGMSGITLIRDNAYSGSDVWASTKYAGSIWSYDNGISVTPYDIFMILGDFVTTGTKSRSVETDNYQGRLLYCYETPTPLFGDVGEATIGDDGFCYVDIDDIFGETISDITEYQVFLQKEGNGDCWIANKQQKYFVIQGTPNMKVGWELKAKQRGYHNIRLESADNKLDEYEDVNNNYLLEDYINEQEELLYGNY